MRIPYGGKIWRGETLVNDHKFKFYSSNTSRVAEAQLDSSASDLLN